METKVFPLLFLLSLFFVPIGSAAIFGSGTVFYSNSSNITVNFTDNVSLGYVSVGDGVVVGNLSFDDGNLSLNFSSADYYVDSSSFPNISRVDYFNWSISSPMVVNTSVGLGAVHCLDRSLSFNGVSYGAGLMECSDFDYLITSYLPVVTGSNHLSLVLADKPVALVNVSDVGAGFGAEYVNVSLSCNHSIATAFNYSLSFNGVVINSGEMNVSDVPYNLTVPVDGANLVVGTCSNSYGDGVDNQTVYIANKNFYLIDETSNSALNLADVDSAVVYFDDNSSSWDFKSAGETNVSFISVNNKLRFIIGYGTGEELTRFIDTDLLVGDMRVCANPENVTHYEQLIISGISREVVMYNVYADCYVASDYTRFAYQNSKLLKAYTIQANYGLDVWDDDVRIDLAGIDGSVASYINIDTLIFNRGSLPVSVTGSSVSVSSVSSSQVAIYYVNIDEDNTAVEVNIYRRDTDELIYSRSSFTNPNEVLIYYDWTTLSNISDETLFEVVVTASVDGEELTVSRYFNVKSGVGIIPSGLGAIIAMMLMIVGITFSSASNTFGWFGILVLLISLAVLGFTVGAWYVLLIGAVNVIALIYVFIIMTRAGGAILT